MLGGRPPLELLGNPAGPALIVELIDTMPVVRDIEVRGG